MGKDFPTFICSPGLSYTFLEAMGMNSALPSWPGPGGHHSLILSFQLPTAYCPREQEVGASAHTMVRTILASLLMLWWLIHYSWNSLSWLKCFSELKGTHIRDLLGHKWRRLEGWGCWMSLVAETPTLKNPMTVSVYILMWPVWKFLFLKLFCFFFWFAGTLFTCQP